MPNLTYQLSRTQDGESHLVVYDTNFKPHLVSSAHPRWDDIVAGVLNDDASALDLIDVGTAVARTILSDRVAYAHNKLYFDGDEIAGELVEHILRLVKEAGVEATKPLVNFLENLNQNPSINSRNQLYSFLHKHDFTITPDGNFIGYKGVYRTGYEGYESSRSGPAIVNGVPHEKGRVQQKVGDVVEMPRTRVADDPSVACSTGLHVSNWRYASNFSSVCLAVEVNPRDVVSVPHDSNNEKIRCCRYKILGEVDAPYDTALLASTENSVLDDAPSDKLWEYIQRTWNNELDANGLYYYDSFQDFVEAEFGLVYKGIIDVTVRTAWADPKGYDYDETYEF